MNNDLKDIIEKFSTSNLTKLRYKKEDFEIELEKDNALGIKESRNISQDNDYNKILAPVVGKYCKSSAAVGSIVKKGEPLCVIEAMKTFNEIYAEYDCIVEEILVKEDTLVECNQELMVVRKND